MPKEEAQLYAANELYNRGWFYHREQRCWFMRAANMEPLLKTNTYERGSYICFDPNTWETIRKKLTTNLKKVLETEMKAKVSKKVNEKMSLFLKKLGDVNSGLNLDIGDFSAIFSSEENDDGTPVTQVGAST